MTAENHPLRLARLAAGISQTQLAALCGVAQHTISKIECGIHCPSPATARQLASAPGLAVTEMQLIYPEDGQ